MLNTLQRKNIILAVIEREGGDKLTNLPTDIGGWTHFGITYRTFCKWTDLYRPGQEDVNRRRAFELMSQELAIDIYDQMFFTHAIYDHLPTWFAELIFDFHINKGEDDAVKMLQFLHNNFINAKYRLAVDGVCGPKTLKALGEWMAYAYGGRVQDAAQPVISLYFVERVRAHINECERLPKQIANMEGWFNRCVKLCGIVE